MINQRRLLDPPCPEDQHDLGYNPDLFRSISRSLQIHQDIYRVKSFSRDNYTYVINHPQYIKHILQSNHKNYHKGLGFDRVEVLLGNGLIVSDGELWKRQRQMIQPAFHKKVIAGLIDLMVDSNLKLYQRWQARSIESNYINLGQEMSRVTLQIMLAALFSEDLTVLTDNSQDNPFNLLTEETTRNLVFAQKFRALGKLIMKVVNDRRDQHRFPNDLVGMMMSARDKATGEPMSDRQLLDEIFTMIVAGHETTASSLSWIWFLLSQHGEEEAQLHRELSFLATESLDLAALNGLPYTSGVVNEALRLYPPGWIIPRRSVHDDQIGDYLILAGSDIFICPYFLHRDSRWWKAPNDFKPQRFLAENAGELPDKYCYIPFSIGPRKCIGDFLALVEMKIHLAVLLPRVRLKARKNLRIELDPQINLRSKHPIMMEVHFK